MKNMKKEPEFCIICGEKMDSHFNGKPYCKKHYLQMLRHGKILERTIFDKNEWKIFKNYAICITYDKNGTPNGIVKVDKDKVDDLKQYKIYIRNNNNNNKQYACIAINGRKVLLHRYLMQVYNTEYNLNNVVDHINGDGLDDRMCNLRHCSHKQNMQNIRKGGKIIGVSKSQNKNNRWVARIMSNYKTINIGYYDTFEEAALARFAKEKEICGEFGPNKDYYYLLDHSSPIEELKKILQEEA